MTVRAGFSWLSPVDLVVVFVETQNFVSLQGTVGRHWYD